MLTPADRQRLQEIRERERALSDWVFYSARHAADNWPYIAGLHKDRSRPVSVGRADEAALAIDGIRADIPWLLEKVRQLEDTLSTSRHPCDIEANEARLMAENAELKAQIVQLKAEHQDQIWESWGEDN